MVQEQLIQKLDNAIDRKDAATAKQLARSIDEASLSEGVARNKTKTDVLLKLGYPDTSNAEATLETAVGVILYLGEGGLNKGQVSDVVSKLHLLICYSEDKLEIKREYLGLEKKEFIELIMKYPSIPAYSEDNLERKRNYLGLEKKEFTELVMKFPPILNYGEKPLDRKLYWFYAHADMSKDDVIQKYSYLSQSPNLRVLPRTRYMNEIGAKLGDISLRQLVGDDDERFLAALERKGFEVDRKEFMEIKRIFDAIDSMDKGKAENQKKKVAVGR